MCMQDKVTEQFGAQAGHLFAMVMAMADATHTVARVTLTHQDRTEIEKEVRDSHAHSMSMLLSHAAVGMGLTNDVVKKVMALAGTVVRNDLDEMVEARGNAS